MRPILGSLYIFFQILILLSAKTIVAVIVPAVGEGKERRLAAQKTIPKHRFNFTGAKTNIQEHLAESWDLHPALEILYKY